MEYFLLMVSLVYGVKRKKKLKKLSKKFVSYKNIIAFFKRTIENYKKEAQCIIDQYSGYKSPQTPYNVNK
jgi:hypothetical protein